MLNTVYLTTNTLNISRWHHVPQGVAHDVALPWPGRVRQRATGRAIYQGTIHLPVAVDHGMVNVLADGVAT